VASAFDNEFVIDGNATLGEEICALPVQFDYVLVPIGGGGLSAGIVKAVRASKRNINVVGAEPLIANDAARSLREGRIVTNEQEPQTLADGARTLSLGRLNWEILRHGLESIIEVPEECIAEAVRLLYSQVNLKVEPTGALGLAAVLTAAHKFQGQKVCCVASGGNVDPAIYARIISAV
jgi:threonine dehydratase